MPVTARDEDQTSCGLSHLRSPIDNARRNAPLLTNPPHALAMRVFPILYLGGCGWNRGFTYINGKPVARFRKGGCTQKVSKNRGLKESVVGIPNKMNVNERRIPLGRIGKTRE